MLDTARAPLWELQARQWAMLTPPLRPAAEDVALVQRTVDGWCASRGRAPRALVLGSTPEIATLRWPPGSHVVAVDRSLTMLHGVWLRARASSGSPAAVAGEWLQLPVADACCDLIIGDGSFASVRKAEGPTLARIVGRLLRADGLLLLRMFVRPPADESPNAVWSDLLDGRVGSFSAFKLRLLMALRDADGETRVHDAWRYVHERAPSLDSLARRTGCPSGEVETIQAYRDQPTIYWFPVLREFRAALAEAFVESDCHHPSYELGDRCPTLLLAPRT